MLVAAMLVLGVAPAASAAPAPVPTAATVAAAAPGDAQIRLALRGSGLSKPVFLTYPRDGSGRLFIVEQTGRIRIYQNGEILGSPGIRERLAVQGAEPVIETPDQFAGYLRGEVDKWAKVIKASGLGVE